MNQDIELLEDTPLALHKVSDDVDDDRMDKDNDAPDCCVKDDPKKSIKPVCKMYIFAGKDFKK